MGDRQEFSGECADITDTSAGTNAEQWARGSGAIFESDKTIFIRFFRPLQPGTDRRMILF